MKKFLAILLTVGIFFMTGSNFVSAKEKILVAYFSRTGNTKIVSEIIAEKVGADIFEIKPEQNYPANYQECLKISSNEKAMKARPKFIGGVENFSEYDTIFLGYPIWYGDAPMIIYSFLENYNFAGKNIVPFCTHGGSGLSSTDQQFTLACPNSKILQGFEIRGKFIKNNSAESKQKIFDWLSKIGYIK